MIEEYYHYKPSRRYRLRRSFWANEVSWALLVGGVAVVLVGIAVALWQ